MSLGRRHDFGRSRHPSLSHRRSECRRSPPHQNPRYQRLYQAISLSNSPKRDRMLTRQVPHRTEDGVEAEVVVHDVERPDHGLLAGQCGKRPASATGSPEGSVNAIPGIPKGLRKLSATNWSEPYLDRVVALEHFFRGFRQWPVASSMRSNDVSAQAQRPLRGRDRCPRRKLQAARAEHHRLAGGRPASGPWFFFLRNMASVWRKRTRAIQPGASGAAA